MSCSSIDLSAGSVTSPIGRGRRAALGEGLRSLVRAAPPHPICCANRPLPAGERWTERAEGLIQSEFIPLERPSLKTSPPHHAQVRVEGGEITAHNSAFSRRNSPEVCLRSFAP